MKSRRRLLMNSLKAIPYMLPVMMLVVSIPLALNMIGPNRFYGVRSAQAFESPEAWYAINQQTAVMSIIGAVLALIAVYAYGRIKTRRSKRGFTKRFIVQCFMGVGITMFFQFIRF